MAVLLKDAHVYSRGVFVSRTLTVPCSQNFELYHCFVFPGLVDVHVHLREPGFFYKETIRTGTAAAAHGGYTTICAMPNLNPVPDCAENLRAQQEIIDRDAVVRVLPYGAITKGQQGQVLSELPAMALHVCAFSDDGRGVQSDSLMRQAMEEAKRLGKLIVAHCEDNSLLHGGCIHNGAYARAHNLPGISSESEWRQVERDLKLVQETGCAYHVCHVSTRESVALLRQAKKDGLDVTCETAPHYLLLTDSDLQDDGRFKMNPPIRAAADRDALLEGLLDGTVDMIATDHAPHSREEKSKGLRGSLNGIVGLETAFPVLYTKLVKPGILPLARLIELMSVNPCRRFSIDQGDDFTVFDLGASSVIDPEAFLSMGRATPFAFWEVSGVCRLTQCRGTLAYCSTERSQP